MVCLGNICRSPIADVVLSARLVEAGLADLVEVSSAGTGDWHVGQPMDHRAAATLAAAGYDPSAHRARHFPAHATAEHDLVLVMDRANLRDVGRDAEGRVRLFREFDPIEPGGEVPDPYYGGAEGFEEVLAMVERTVTALLEELGQALDVGPGRPGGRRG